MSIVIGIPTVKRDKQSYLLDTLSSVFSEMSASEKDDCVVVVFIAEVRDNRRLWFFVWTEKKMSIWTAHLCKPQVRECNSLSSGSSQAMPPTNFTPLLELIHGYPYDYILQVKWNALGAWPGWSPGWVCHTPTTIGIALMCGYRNIYSYWLEVCYMVCITTNSSWWISSLWVRSPCTSVLCYCSKTHMTVALGRNAVLRSSFACIRSYAAFFGF